MAQYPPPGQYPPPPGQYPPPPGQGQPNYWQESPKRKGLAITTLVLGILGFLSCWTLIGGYLFGFFALIFGIIALVKIRSGSAGGTGMAVTGLILGVLALVAAVVLSIVGWSFFVDSGGKDYLDCLQKAGNDQTKQNECRDKWEHSIEQSFSVTLTPRPTP
ncbi:DUF4190 domain-containing protein [Nocardia pseudovaccinii]|uniref:DUF4190 domain-containing protein n=1 Tax=Nocardia pseudovaccinii TaxID=189540 RepID=UPI0007A39419|nr:DUF4190 domain-containing protein [Nocardia pseudovaccinii]